MTVSMSRSAANGKLNRIIAAQTSYLLYASDNNQNFKITQLDADYYNVTTQVNVLTGMFCRNSLGNDK